MSSAVLDRGSQTLRWLLNIISAPISKERPYSLSHLCAGLWLRLPMYPHLSLRWSPVATGLEVIGWDKSWLMSCTWLCLKWSRWAWSRGKTRSRRLKTRGDVGAAVRWRIRQPTTCGALLLIFCWGSLPYTEGSQLLIFTSRIWWHDLFTYTYTYILLNASRRRKTDRSLLFKVKVDELKSIYYYY